MLCAIRITNFTQNIIKIMIIDNGILKPVHKQYYKIIKLQLVHSFDAKYNGFHWQ